MRKTAGFALAVLAGILGTGTVALAQGTPRPSANVPYPSQQQQANRQQQPSSHDLRCLQLEQELLNDWTSPQQRRSQLPQIDKDIKKYDRLYQSTRAKAERSGCYQSMFIFGRSLVRSPKCLRMHRTIEDARRKLASLQQQRSSISNPTSRSRRKEELISALARAGCGSQYQRETRRRSGGWFTSLFEEDSYSTRRDNLQTSRIEAFTPYRTLCVRTCDGYYFPVSYQALPSRFSSDVSKCQSQCAAPAELFVYRNPGEEPEQMVSSDGRRAYNDLPNAWRYRKEYVKGCSCKSTEYDPAEIEVANQKAEAEKAAKEAGKVAQDSKQTLKRQ